ncbi:MAG: preprotein translocase subunit SecY [Candidatus Dadabacteria bacterium]|nr:MAG: preprotein translocase subunit SecY [Candidatus Dadabacteria bacterium]
MIGGLGDVGKIPELRKRIVFTLLMLAVYRFGVFVSTPGIDVDALRKMFDTGGGTLFGMINMFSGGSLENFSIFTLGIIPYISVSIIIQVLTPTIPALEALKKEGEAGRRVLTRYTRQGTILLAILQSMAISFGLEKQGLVIVPGWTFRIGAIISLTAGTAFLMWLGEQITEKGIGNGISILIFAGIVARMPQVLALTADLIDKGEIQPLSGLLLIAFSILTVAAIVFVERSHRKIPIQYPRRMVGKNLAQAQTQYMPLKVNMAGVIPPIFASSFLVVPATIASFSPNEFFEDLGAWVQPGTWSYTVIFVALIILFSFFYTAIIFNPEEMAENLKKNGGFIPTVRPGKQTADYLYAVLNRLTVWGSIYIAIVCVVPQLFYFEMGAEQFAYVFGGTAILIAVGVTLDTASQIESYVVARNYEAFMSKSSKKRGGIGSMSYARRRILRR